MRHLPARFWWILVLRGILGLLLGLEAFWLVSGLVWEPQDLFGFNSLLAPEEIWTTLIFLLGLYAFLDGLFAIVLGAQDYGGGKRWWGLVAEGAFSIGLWIVTWLRPGPTLMVLLYWIAIWAVVTGFLEMNLGLRGTEYRDRRGPFFYAGLCSVAFGLSVLAPGVSGITLLWIFGLFAFFFGVPLLVLGFHLRRFAQRGMRII